MYYERKETNELCKICDALDFNIEYVYRDNESYKGVKISLCQNCKDTVDKVIKAIPLMYEETIGDYYLEEDLIVE